MASERIWTKTFWVALVERAVSTASQSALLVIGADQFNAIEANWATIGSFAAGGAALAVLKGLAVNAVTEDGPGLTMAERVDN